MDLQSRTERLPGIPTYLWLGKSPVQNVPALIKYAAAFSHDPGRADGQGDMLVIGASDRNVFRMAVAASAELWEGPSVVNIFATSGELLLHMAREAAEYGLSGPVAWLCPTAPLDPDKAMGMRSEMVRAMSDTGAKVVMGFLPGVCPRKGSNVDGWDLVCSVPERGISVMNLVLGSPVVFDASLSLPARILPEDKSTEACRFVSYMYDKSSGYGTDGSAIARAGRTSNEGFTMDDGGVSSVLCDVVERIGKRTGQARGREDSDNYTKEK